MKTYLNMAFGVATAFLFVACGNSEDTSTSTTVMEEVAVETIDSTYYLTKGKDIALATFEALSSQLKEQIVAHGPDSAIGFCNIEAMPLTDSLSELHHVQIQRIATRFRNPQNEAAGGEAEIIQHYETLVQEGTGVKPSLAVNQQNEVVFYAPILLKPQCLACHGQPETQIAPSTLSLLNRLYPDDRATGFAEGDVRGMWKITFKN